MASTPPAPQSIGQRHHDRLPDHRPVRSGSQCCSTSSSVVLPHSPQLALATKRRSGPSSTTGRRSVTVTDVVLLLALAGEAVRDGFEFVGTVKNSFGATEAHRELEVVPRACAS